MSLPALWFSPLSPFQLCLVPCSCLVFLTEEFLCNLCVSAIVLTPSLSTRITVLAGDLSPHPAHTVPYLTLSSPISQLWWLSNIDSLRLVRFIDHFIRRQLSRNLISKNTSNPPDLVAGNLHSDEPDPHSSFSNG